MILILAIFLKHINADPYFCKKNTNDKFYDIYSDKCFKTNEQLKKVEKLFMIKSTRSQLRAQKARIPIPRTFL